MKLTRALQSLVPMILSVACDVRPWPSDRGTLDRLQARLEDGEMVIDMAELAPFPWTRLLIFQPYTSQKVAEATLGFEWIYHWSAVENLDDRNFVVLADSARVVAAFELLRSVAEIEVPDRWVARESARFVVQRGDSSRPKLVSVEPLFESDLWPGEGVPVLEAAAETLQIYARPRLGFPPIATRRTKRGERIAFDSTRYQTMSPGAVGGRDSIVTGRWYGANLRHLRLDDYYATGRDTVLRVSHSTLWYLQYRAEGQCFYRLNADVLEMPCDGVPSSSVLWWAYTPGPGTAGWFLVSDSTVSPVGRRF